MGDISTMTKGELRAEVLALRLLTNKIYRDCCEVEDDWLHGIATHPFGKGLVEQAKATMKMIEEYRKGYGR